MSKKAISINKLPKSKELMTVVSSNKTVKSHEPMPVISIYKTGTSNEATTAKSLKSHDTPAVISTEIIPTKKPAKSFGSFCRIPLLLDHEGNLSDPIEFSKFPRTLTEFKPILEERKAVTDERKSEFLHCKTVLDNRRFKMALLEELRKDKMATRPTYPESTECSMHTGGDDYDQYEYTYTYTDGGAINYTDNTTSQINTTILYRDSTAHPSLGTVMSQDVGSSTER